MFKAAHFIILILLSFIKTGSAEEASPACKIDPNSPTPLVRCGTKEVRYQSLPPWRKPGAHYSCSFLEGIARPEDVRPVTLVTVSCSNPDIEYFVLDTLAREPGFLPENCETLPGFSIQGGQGRPVVPGQDINNAYDPAKDPKAVEKSNAAQRSSGSELGLDELVDQILQNPDGTDARVELNTKIDPVRRQQEEDLLLIAQEKEPLCYSPGSTHEVDSAQPIAPPKTPTPGIVQMARETIAEIPEPEHAWNDPISPKLTLEAFITATLPPDEKPYRGVVPCIAGDQSGSMMDDIPFMGKYWDVASKIWKTRYSEGLLDSQFIGMGQHTYDSFQPELLMETNSLELLKTSFLNFKSDGSTVEPLLDSIGHCLSYLENQNIPDAYKTAIIITDEPGDILEQCTPSIQALIQRAEASGIAIHIIGPPEVPEPSRPKYLDATYSPDGKKIITLTKNGMLQVLDTTNRSVLLEYPVLSNADLESASIAISPDGTKIAVTASLPSVNRRHTSVLDLTTGTRLWKQEGSFDGFESDPRFSQDSASLLLTRNSRAQLLNVRTGEIIQDIQSAIPTTNAIFSPDETQILMNQAAGSRNEMDRIWAYHLKKKQIDIWLDPYEDTFQRPLAVSNDGSLLVTSEYSELRVYDFKNRVYLKRFATVSSTPEEAYFFPDNQRVLILDEDGYGDLINVDTGERLNQYITGPNGPTHVFFRGLTDLKSVSLSNDGRKILGITEEGYLNIWDVQGTQIQPVELYFSPPLCHESYVPGVGHQVGPGCGVTRFDPSDTRKFPCDRNKHGRRPSTNERTQKDTEETQRNRGGLFNRGSGRAQD